ncbi:head morphogenesis protein [Atopobacter sp. AH10]|nr:head morphogenesis protein [Atopobacter sp. AH10]
MDKDGKIEERKNEALNLAMAKKRGKKIYITDQAIEKVPFVEIPGYSQEENKRIQEAHKVLLRDAQQNNQSNEVMHITTEGKPVVVYGDQVSVDINKSVQARYLINSSPDRSLTILHNHPGGSSFSANDVQTFMSHDSVKTLTIVTNQGKVMYLTKTDRFDKNSARDLSRDVSLDKDMDKYLVSVIKAMYNAGVRYILR